MGRGREHQVRQGSAGASNPASRGGPQGSPQTPARRGLRLAGLWEDQGFVFPSETGSLLNPSNLRNRSFKRIKARSGVREDLRFHDLRHTCATLLLSEGVNAKVVSEILGHASITITLNTYSHVLTRHA